eukprot:10584436-Ditylum_brightwellii.AAC.1
MKKCLAPHGLGPVHLVHPSTCDRIVPPVGRDARCTPVDVLCPSLPQEDLPLGMTHWVESPWGRHPR